MDINEIDVCTFDCYGTLINWEGGIGAFLYDVALWSGDDNPPPGGEMRVRWEAIQFDMIRGPYLSYKEILAQSLRLWCEERGYVWREDMGAWLVRSMRSWQPFHDTTPALNRVQQAGLKLVIVSNTDNDIIRHSLQHMGVDFDDVITAEECGAYKPSLTVFEQALERIDVAPARILHVAFGFKYDNGPAQQIGMHTAWVNRAAEPQPDGPIPDFTWRDLWGLAEVAEQRSRG
ncbi:MAG: haloacid dehalogenase type II [Thermomicrobiales bacterium]